MNEVVRVPDIAVCHGGALHSLRGQGVVKSGSLERFEGGSGVVKEGGVYVLEDDWIVSMTTTGVEVLLRLECDEDMTIDWGDGFAELVGRNRSRVTVSRTYTDGLASHRIVLRGKNTALTHLLCGSNNLSEVDVSKNIALMELYCHDNNLTSLDISKNVALTNLSCSSNSLSEVDVSKNVALTDLACGDNNLTALDISKNVALIHLSCGSNNLSEVDVSKNIALTELYCPYNNLTRLDVSKNVTLAYLQCDRNNLSALDVSKNIALIFLRCETNTFLSDPERFTEMANTLVDRTGLEAGDLRVYSEVVPVSINSICAAKNWNIVI